MAEKKVEATLRAYEPTLREKIYQALAGTEQRPSADRMNFARGIADLAEFVPGLGNVLLGQEASRRGDTKGMLMAALPLPGAARGKAALGALEKRALESFRPMNAFERNMYGASTGGRPYIPEMAVTDFETYGPFNRQSSGPMAGRATGFDRNAYEAWKQGRFNRMAGRPEPMGGDYTLEDLGQAVAPYRQGGLVYEPVGSQAGPRQIGGPGMAARLGYARGPIEGEWSDVYGIAGPRTGTAMTAGPRPYGGSMDFGVTREGMAASPSGRMFDPRVAAGAAGIGYLAGLPREQQQMAQAGGTAPRGTAQLPPIDVFGPRGMSALSGQTPGAGTAFEAPRRSGAPQGKRAGAKKKGAEQGPPMPAKGAFEPNFNYLVTQAIDRLLDQNEAEKGRQFEEYYATNPWPY